MKKKLLLINSVCGIRSTGRICWDIAKEYDSKEWDVRIAYGRMGGVPADCQKYAIRIGSALGVWIHALLTRLFDWCGTGISSYFATKTFLKWAEEWKPDVVWLHNIHGYYINYPLLFKWIKTHSEMEVRWTLHDCWSFTGHCGYMLLSNCEEWKTGCKECNEKQDYPKSWLCNNARRDWRIKKESFTGIKNMTLITPSRWLANLTRQSFLKDYPVKVVPNTIDLQAFKPCESDFRKRQGLLNKKIILGVASSWDKRKGLEDFVRLQKLLPNDCVIILVGLTTRQIKCLPRGIVGISRTNSKQELAEIYSAADVFFNPTREDNYPTVNLEAKACGCPIVTYDTGGTAETVDGYDKAEILFGTEKCPEGFLRVAKRRGFL